ncbi:energy-coupling factor transporter ATPase [Salipaludibacillus keqinensis]|uniref:Energy-coupling factor transporter ATPase n=1 Tax=Salipaludibacillus keqinensis TaxID=2045207 RepID=A0A323TA61_9BACI|nr:energy-coupling factor transporter ATPase [Salipaludibacillus keqinensis]PYZ91886.1 energy-coupling factor transporter ATPase [Salipaludibacillus keqinensis]
MTNELSVEHLHFRYHEQAPYVLKDIWLTVPTGEWLTILGHNGSGKSTLAKFFNALLVPTEGGVISCGMDTKDEHQWTNIRRQVAMVFQNPDNQIVAPTVEDDVAFGLENAGIPYDEMRERVYSSIERLGLKGLETQEPHSLSGGQKQRVALAGALALKPRIIVLDEATSMLDPTGKKEVLAMVQKLKEEENITIISITHDVSEAMIADRIVVLNEGQLVLEGTPREILKDDETLKKSSLSAPFSVQVANELRKHHVAIADDVFSEEELINALCTYKQTN